LTAYTVLRFTKLKSWGAVGGAGSHNARLRQTLNADPEALPQNRFLVGSPGDDLSALCQARLGGQKIRRNAVYAVEGVMSASPAYFRPDSPEQYGHYAPARLEAWVDASMAWLQNKYGDRVISAVLHLDEATPHLQFLILPLDGKGKLNCRQLFGGSRRVMADLQTEYAQAVAHLGLTRGRPGSKAQHQDVAQYYTATQNLNHTPTPALPAKAEIEVPEPPGAMARLKDKNLTDYARETATKAVEEQAAKLAPLLKTLTERNDLLMAEVNRLREMEERLKADNALISRENAAFKAEAKKLRDLPLDMVLTKMFGATETRDSLPHARRLEMPGGGIIICKGNEWLELPHGKQGKGAINLVMHLSGYGQEHYQQAVRDMAKVFSDQEITASLAHHLAGTVNQTFSTMMRGHFQMPPSSDIHWPEVRDFLLDQLQLPAPLIDKAHENGLIYSDRRKNCVFSSDQDSGALIVNFRCKPFARSLGDDSALYVLPGSDKALYITDSPVEALSLKAMHPESTVIAIGSELDRDKLKPHLEGRARIFLAHGRDKMSEEYARFFTQDYPQANRLLPERELNWNEEWKRQRKEKERAPEQILSLESNHLKASSVEIGNETFKPTAGMGR